MSKGINNGVDDGPVRLKILPDGIAHLRLSRPEAANGLDVDLLDALHKAILRIHGNSDVRVVVLTGDGKNFCAGGDVHTFLSKGAELPDYIRVATAKLQVAVSALIRLSPPVIAAVQGYAAGGGGMGLVCSADLVVASESSRFLAGATRVGMVPDAGVSVTLTHLVGFRQAMEILLLNPVIKADEALQMGLVTRVVPDEKLTDEAMALARQIAAGAPAALANTKRLLWDGLGQGVEAVMARENETQAVLSGMSDALEGLAAVIEERAPQFKGR